MYDGVTVRHRQRRALSTPPSCSRSSTTLQGAGHRLRCVCASPVTPTSSCPTIRTSTVPTRTSSLRQEPHRHHQARRRSLLHGQDEPHRSSRPGHASTEKIFREKLEAALEYPRTPILEKVYELPTYTVEQICETYLPSFAERITPLHHATSSKFLNDAPR